MLGKTAFILAALAILPIKACENNQLSTQEKFEYQSFNVELEREFFNPTFANTAKSAKKITLSGQLFLPKDASTPMPAVILQHGSGGIKPLKSWYQQATAAITANHIAVLIADSHTARGLGSTANDQTILSSATRLLDTVQALKKLAKDPRIDHTRIAIIGDSYGGFITMRLAEIPVMQAMAPNGERFAAHAMLYPACNATPRQIKLTNAPMLFLLGQKDDYTRAEDCLNYIKRIQKEGYKNQYHIFPQAYHGWLYNIPPIYFSRAQTFNQCQIILENDGNMNLPNYKIKSEGINLKQFYQNVTKSGCIKLGAHVGANSQARKQSLKKITKFLKENLITTKINPQ